jgi:hypothetical protein
MGQWNRERFLYAIFTLDENHKVNGVYVGSANEIKLRIDNHLGNKREECGKQKELHDIMRTGAFVVRELNKVNHETSWKEYDWIRFFRDYTNLKIFNTMVNCYLDKNDSEE